MVDVKCEDCGRIVTLDDDWNRSTTCRECGGDFYEVEEEEYDDEDDDDYEEELGDTKMPQLEVIPHVEEESKLGIELPDYTFDPKAKTKFD